MLKVWCHACMKGYQGCARVAYTTWRVYKGVLQDTTMHSTRWHHQIRRREQETRGKKVPYT
jgi:hypothetical protein